MFNKKHAALAMGAALAITASTGAIASAPLPSGTTAITGWLPTSGDASLATKCSPLPTPTTSGLPRRAAIMTSGRP